MQYSIVKACLLALAATTSVVAQAGGFNVITKPVEGEVVAAGKTYTIEWIPTLPSQDVSLVVLQGASNITLQLGATIASGVPSSVGKYDWAIPADSSFAVYGIKIQLDSDPTVFQYSNQFKVSAAAESKSATTTVKVSQISTAAEAPKATSAIAAEITPVAPVHPVSTIVAHTTIAANCSCTKGKDGKLTSTGTAPFNIATSYPVLTTLVSAPYKNGTATYVAPPSYTAPAVPSDGASGDVPTDNGPAGNGTQTEPELPSFTGAAGNVAVSSLTVLGAVALSLMFL